MRTIEQIRALLLTEKDESKRSALLDELQQAFEARANGNGSEKPTKIQELRSRLSEAVTQRSALNDEFEAVTRGAVDDSGDAREFTVEEAEQRGRLRAQLDQADARHDELEDQVRQAEQNERDERSQAAVAQMRRELGLGDQSSALAGITDINEHRTYERGNGLGYLYDVTVQSLGPGLGSAWSQARERLQRHAVENHHEALELEAKANRSAAEDYFVRQMVEAAVDRKSYSGPQVRGGRLSYRALSTAASAGGEFVPPMYLTEQWITYLRAGRVVANACKHSDLPDGTMSLNIPKVSGGTSVDVQGTQNTNVSMTDLQTEYVTFPVVTVAGQQIVSLQLLERSPVSFDDIVMADLAAAHAQRVDLQVINGSGSDGQVTGILNTSGITTLTWTDSAPTIKGLYGQIGTAKRDVAQSIFRPATHLFATPDLAEWVGQSFDGNGRPLAVPQYAGPFNVVQVTPSDAVAEGQSGSNLNGLAFFEDANLPVVSGDDVAIVSRMQENCLYESPVVTRALPQTYGAQLSVLLQLYNYMAFTAARYPTANVAITGSGMANPRTYNQDA